jgi:hypothetical protein
MKQELSLVRLGKYSLYMRIPAWFAHIRNISDDDVVLFMPENVDDDGAVRLKFVKAQQTTEAAE